MADPIGKLGQVEGTGKEVSRGIIGQRVSREPRKRWVVMFLNAMMSGQTDNRLGRSWKQ